MSDLSEVSKAIDPQAVLGALAPEFSGALRADRIGIAKFSERSGVFHNIAMWDRIRTIKPGSVFSATGTAASWVTEFSCPLVGKNLSDMERYPGTLSYLVRESFRSNILLPLELGGFGRSVLYALSRSAHAFAHSTLAVGMRVRDVVEPLLRAHLAMHELLNGSEPIGPDEDPEVVSTPGSYDTLDAVQRRHIAGVLNRTNGIIEGPRGAAAILGLRPSTLRNRMKKLRLSRTDAARD